MGSGAKDEPGETLSLSDPQLCSEPRAQVTWWGNPPVNSNFRTKDHTFCPQSSKPLSPGCLASL